MEGRREQGVGVSPARALLSDGRTPLWPCFQGWSGAGTGKSGVCVQRCCVNRGNCFRKLPL